MFPGPLAAVVVTAALGLGGYCYHRFDTLAKDGEEWLSSYFSLQASRRAATLSNVIGFSLPELVASYFAITAPEVPVPMDVASLRQLVAQMQTDPDTAPYTQRYHLTEPLTRAVLGGMLDKLPELTPGVVLTDAVIEGIMKLGAPSVDATAYQQRLHVLARWYAALGIVSLAFAAAVFVAWATPSAGPLAVALFVVVLIAGITLELCRDRCRALVHLSKTAAELAHS